MIVIQRHGISFKKEDKTFTLVKNGFSNGDSVISPRILEIGESKLYTCIGVFVWKKIGSFE